MADFRFGTLRTSQIHSEMSAVERGADVGTLSGAVAMSQEQISVNGRFLP
jgi:hypothetical protein